MQQSSYTSLIVDGGVTALDLLQETWAHAPDTHWLVVCARAPVTATSFDLAKFARKHSIEKIALVVSTDDTGLILRTGGCEVRLFADRRAAAAWLTDTMPLP